MSELERIINGCIDNNRTAQEEFFKIYYGRFMAISQMLSPNNNIAQDIIQDAFMKMFDNLHTLDKIDEATIFSWGKIIIRNCVIDFYRKEKKFMHNFDIVDIPNSWVDTDDTSYIDFKDIEQHQVFEAIQSLSPQYKLVFNMYVIDGLRHEEIGETLGISIGASKSNLSRAKVQLRKKLEEYAN